ncbi:MAG: flagellar M-ring protein FliF, partial [Bilophila sp.]
MPNFVTLATEKALGFWRQISLTQRIFVAGLALLVIGGFFGFIFWINQPNYKILYSNLGVEDANRVVKMLQA